MSAPTPAEPSVSASHYRRTVLVVWLSMEGITTTPLTATATRFRPTNTRSAGISANAVWSPCEWGYTQSARFQRAGTNTPKQHAFPKTGWLNRRRPTLGPIYLCLVSLLDGKAMGHP